MPSLSFDQKRFYVDLALAYGRSVQRETGFVHTPDGVKIPLYDNLCFALTLLKTRTVEGALEARALLERLFAFDSFPNFLHDHPKEGHPLRPAVALALIDRHFGEIVDVKGALATLWGRCQPGNILYDALQCHLEGGERPEARGHLDDQVLAAELLDEEWGYEAWNSHLQLAPAARRRSLYDFAMALKENRYLKEMQVAQPLHLYLSLLTPRVLWEKESPKLVRVDEGEGYRLFWQGHVLEKKGSRIVWTWDPKMEMRVNGAKATLFFPGDTVTIRSEGYTLSIRLKAEGRFCYHMHPVSDTEWGIVARCLDDSGHEVIDCDIDIWEGEGEARFFERVGSGDVVAQEELVGSLAGDHAN